jgi:hypothetical protein
MAFQRVPNHLYPGSFLANTIRDITGSMPDCTLGAEFDSNILLDVVCDLTIQHYVGKDGRTYANIIRIQRCSNQEISEPARAAVSASAFDNADPEAAPF